MKIKTNHGSALQRWFSVVCVCLSIPAFCRIGLAEPQGKLLLQEKFESTTTKDGQAYTQPEIFPYKDQAPGGHIVGKTEIVEGKVGKALRFHGLSEIRYPAGGRDVDLSGGEISFWVALNFDPAEKNERTRTVLRNQLFTTFMGPGRTRLIIYTCLADVSMLVQNEAGNIVFSKNCPFVWKPNVWHHIGLRWGKEMELWVDDEKKASGPWEGMFGSIPVKQDEMFLTVGSLIGWGDMESEFAMDEFTIRGPQPGQISSRPRIALPLLNEEPVMDGKLTDAFWQKAAKTSGFAAYNKKDMAAIQPTIYAAYNTRGLYFGLDAPLPNSRTPRAVLTERDSPIYNGEDSLEVFVQPTKSDAAIYQFIASALGTRFDSKTVGEKTDVGGYNPDWQVKTEGQAGRWTAEIFIPFNSLDVSNPPQLGDVWKANFCLDVPDGFTNAATWSYTSGNYNQPVYFGELLFTGKVRSLREEKFGGFQEGEPLVGMKIIGEFAPIVTVHGELTDASGKSLFDYKMPLRDADSTEVKPPPLTTGNYTLALSAIDENGVTLFRQNLSFQTAKALSLTVENYPYAEYLQMTADTKGLKEPLSNVACAVTSADKKAVGNVEIKEFKGGVGTGTFANENLAPGLYEVEATAVSADGKSLATAKQTFKVFARPSWWKNNLGIDHSVPPPFQPVKVSAQALSVWGRDYMFGGSVFPQQIVDQKVNLFDQPPAFNLTVDGQSLNVGKIARTGKDAYPDAVSYTGSRKFRNFAVSCRTTVEFDGFVRYDMTLTPSQSAKVDELTLTFPLRKDLVRFLLASSGSSGNVMKFDKEFSTSFLPYLWLGNDDMGFAFFSESDQYWTPQNKKMLQVVASDRATLLKANFITQPITISKPITISFGLMTTPIRNVPLNDPYRYPSYDLKGNVSFPEFLTYPNAETGLPKEGTLEFWHKRSDANSKSNTELFHFMVGKKQVNAYLMTPGEPNVVALIVGDKRILSASNVSIDAQSFAHLALTWDKDNLALYCNGKLAGKGDARVFNEVLAGGAGQLRFGCHDEWQGYTGIVIDEMRLSNNVRYQGDSFASPQAPFTRDDATVLLDHFEESFKPDGQDGQTAAGGTPTIGCAFVSAQFGKGLKIEVGPSRPALEVMKEMGIKVVSHWAWQKPMIEYYGQPVLFGDCTPGLKEEINQYHKYGIPIIPYAAYPAISAPSPLADQFGDEWGIRPLSTLPWQMLSAPKDYYLLNSCVNAKGFADYLVGGAAWAMDQFGFDGIYTDGLAHVYACQNRAHGCGYVDDAGNLHSTWPFFATRETLKRMYRVIKSRHPNGFLVNHASFDYIMPTLSFSDIVYTGEHEDYENLLTTRVRFCSKPWGLYVTTLGSSEHIYSSLHTMMSLLNGVSIWGSGLLGRNDFARKEARISAAYHAFNTSTAEWVPYYNGEGSYYQVNDPKVKVSLYYHRGKDALIIVGNLNREARKVDLKLDLARVGLQGKALKAVSVMTELPIPVSQSGSLDIDLNAKTFVLLRMSGA